MFFKVSCPDICLQVKNSKFTIRNYSFPQSNTHATREVLLRKRFEILNSFTYFIMHTSLLLVIQNKLKIIFILTNIFRRANAGPVKLTIQ